MTRVAVAASSRIAADAGVEVARAGGNAVDAAIAASMVQLVTEPGVVSLGAGALVVVWPADGDPVLVDGAAEMPGRSAPPERFGRGIREVLLPYGGGTPTGVGHGSVATPGAIAGYELAARHFSRVPWRLLVEPARDHVRAGFPMPAASSTYLAGTREGIFGWNAAAMAALLDESGRVLAPGATVRIEHLDASLDAIARDGAAALHRGDLARAIAEECMIHDGLLGRDDLEAYVPRLRPALALRLDDWALATAAAPSVGGASLAAMLLLMRDAPDAAWTPATTAHAIEVQRRVSAFRRERLDRCTELDPEVRALLEEVRARPSGFASPSTVHASAVDGDGLACAITASAGYGSGVMPPGTGIWLNNSLGEVELNRLGFHALTPGTRLPTNMAPTVGRRRDGAALAVGSPGADRITSAILCTLTNFVHLGMPLASAVEHPRLHVEWSADDRWSVAHEPGLPVEELGVPYRSFPGPDMFFGGVAAVCHEPGGHFSLAADPRRTGGTASNE